MLMPSGIPPRVALEQEAAALHRVLFGHPISPELAQQYAGACRRLLAQDSATQQVSVPALIAKSVDLEAVELALRLRNPDNTLTKRFHILMFLAESRSSHFQHYVSKRGGFWRALLSLSFASFRSLYKFLKGTWQVRYHSVL